MSIDAKVEGLAVVGEKLILRPSSFDEICARDLYLTPEIVAIAKPPFADSLDGERYAALEAFLNAFSELNAITVCQDPDKKRWDVMLARVRPVEDEFWSMRITDPNDSPGMRILGAFCGKDSFVGLTCDFRENIKDFDEEVATVKAAWRQLFGDTGPHSGSTLDDYLTNYDEQ